MTTLPPSPFFDSGGSQASPDEAAAPFPRMPSVGAAAEIPEPPSSTGGFQESPAPLQELVGAGDLGTDLIGEIFAGARKLEQLPGIFDQAAITPADELLYVTLKAMDDPYAADLIDIPAGMWGEFDPAPLFLQMQA